LEAAAVAAATAAVVVDGAGDVEADVAALCDFELELFAGGELLLLLCDGDDWVAALCARKATNRFARNGLLVGIVYGLRGGAADGSWAGSEGGAMYKWTAEVVMVESFGVSVRIAFGFVNGVRVGK
jgi:hypothetical protein